MSSLPLCPQAAEKADHPIEKAEALFFVLNLLLLIRWVF